MTSADDPAERIADLVLGMYQIHAAVLAETGGLEGLRDAHLLHAAAARPFATFGGQPLYRSEFEQAAALFHSLIKSHPFMDGTKRTAFLSALWFLHLCGHAIPSELPRDASVSFCVAVAEEGLHPDQPTRTVGEIAEWFQKLLA